MLRTNDLIFMLLDGLEVFFNIYGVSLVSRSLKMAGVRHIYKPPSLGAVALMDS